jgi:hypothetical protein
LAAARLLGNPEFGERLEKGREGEADENINIKGRGPFWLRQCERS